MFIALKEAILLVRLYFNRFRTYPRYTGPMIDAMGQINKSITAEHLEKVLDKSGVIHLALFGRHDGPMNSNPHVVEISKQLGNKIVLGSLKGFDHQYDIPESFVKSTLENIKDGARFVGELQFTHADKYSHSTDYNITTEVNLDGERYIDPLAPNVLKLMDKLKGKGIPVMTHWEMYNWERDWPKFDKLFTMYPDIDFIIPHSGYNGPIHAHEILRRHHSHVYITLSKREMFHFKYKWRSFKGYDLGRYTLASYDKLKKLSSSMLEPNGKIQRQWFNSIRRYPNNFMFATDCHKPPAWHLYPNIIDHWRDILGQFPKDIAEKVAYQNAKKLYKIKD